MKLKSKIFLYPLTLYLFANLFIYYTSFLFLMKSFSILGVVTILFFGTVGFYTFFYLTQKFGLYFQNTKLRVEDNLKSGKIDKFRKSVFLMGLFYQTILGGVVFLFLWIGMDNLLGSDSFGYMFGFYSLITIAIVTVTQVTAENSIFVFNAFVVQFANFVAAMMMNFPRVDSFVCILLYWIICLVGMLCVTKYITDRINKFLKIAASENSEVC